MSKSFGLCAIVLAAAVAAALALGAGSVSGEGPESSAAQTSVEEELAQKYAPILKITNQKRECDKGGNVYEPAPVEILFDNPEIVLRKHPGRELVKTAPAAADLMGLSDEYYLDFPGNPRRPGCRYERDYVRFREGKPPTIYAHVTGEDGEPGMAVQYWFYYYYNDFANKHEGDWEMIQVMFDEADTPEEALEQEPTRTVYSGHAGGELAGWNDGKLRKVGTRPVVYVTTGSHASFYSEGIFMGVAKRGQVFGCDPTTGPHRDVDPMVVLLPDEPPSDPNDPKAWMSYAGLWGERDRNSIFSGPQGPPVRPRWTGPFTYANQQRDFSDKVPESLLGIDPSTFFCRVVDAGSQFMIFFAEYPWLVGGGIIVLAGMAGMTLVTGLPGKLSGRTGRAVSGDGVEPGRGFLRRARPLKQLGRGTLALYRTHWRLWILTGLMFVPVSMVVMAIDQVIGLEWLNDILNSSVAEPFMEIVGMSLGALISATVVAAGVFASLRRIDEGEPPNVIEAYRLVARRFLVLAAETVLVGLALIALSLTIVGIPFAVNRTIAWGLAGQAVIIEDASALGSMRRSAQLVKGRWWRVAGVILLIGLFVGLPGPLITFAALVFLEPPVLQTIYPVLSMLYVTVLFPMGFLCSGLLYGDLVAEAEAEALAQAAP